MDSQFSIGSPNLSFVPIGQRTKNLSYVKGRIEFEAFGQEIDQVEPTRIQTIRRVTFPTEPGGALFHESRHSAEAR
jgi:hypothetical protein